MSAAVLLLFSVILNSFPVVYPAEGKAGFFLINRMENNMPIFVFKMEKGNLTRAAINGDLGTLVHC